MCVSLDISRHSPFTSYRDLQRHWKNMVIAMYCMFSFAEHEPFCCHVLSGLQEKIFVMVIIIMCHADRHLIIISHPRLLGMSDHDYPCLPAWHMIMIQVLISLLFLYIILTFLVVTQFSSCSLLMIWTIYIQDFSQKLHLVQPACSGYEYI